LFFLFASFCLPTFDLCENVFGLFLCLHHLLFLVLQLYYFFLLREKVEFRFKAGQHEKYNGPFEALGGWLRGKKTNNINGWMLVGINGHLKFGEKVSTFTREDLKEAETILTIVSASPAKLAKKTKTKDFFFLLL